ncbi:PEP-CTERM sorting domain-containing protein [Pirellulaceae bacterium SH449]
MKKLIMASLLSLVTAVSAQADVITQWNFNRDADGNLPASTASPAASIGTGTASLVGGVTAGGTGFASGTVNGGSSEGTTQSATGPLGNNGWQIDTGWSQSAANLSQGVQFAVNTVGFIDDVVVSWDLRQSGTSSRFSAFMFTTDGISWTTISNPALVTIGTDPLGGASNGAVTASSLLTRTLGDRWLNQNSVNLSGLNAGGNADFAFRIVAAHNPDLDTPAFVRTNGTVGDIGGTWRFDMVTVSATAVPEPTSMALLGVVGLGGLVARRFRKKQKSFNESVAA